MGLALDISVVYIENFIWLKHLKVLHFKLEKKKLGLPLNAVYNGHIRVVKAIYLKFVVIYSVCFVKSPWTRANHKIVFIKISVLFAYFTTALIILPKGLFAMWWLNLSPLVQKTINQ